VDWSLVTFAVTTVAAWVSLALYSHAKEETSFTVSIAGVLALVASIFLAVRGRGTARGLLLAGQALVAVGGFGGFLMAVLQGNLRLHW
jgi:hypothetical protein